MAYVCVKYECRAPATTTSASLTQMYDTTLEQIAWIDSLGLPQVLKDVAMTKRGLVIFVGATGSGKSTSLAAIVDWRNENSFGHIITIEDPVEFVHPHKNCIVTQREVGIDTDGWESALKNTLRQAPDVILMGEIRDRETMDHAVAFAETGHLCMATLHANSSNQALDRIINFFPEERRAQLLMDLSLNLKSLVSQRLLPHQEGKGRIAAVEILLNTPLVADMIFKGEVGDIKELEAVRNVFGQQAADQPMISATKSMTGHCLGGAGVQELIYSLLMMKERFVAPSINIDNLDPLAYGVNIIKEARDAVIKVVMSNSFGFGGTNGSIMVAKV